MEYFLLEQYYTIKNKIEQVNGVYICICDVWQVLIIDFGGVDYSEKYTFL